MNRLSFGCIAVYFAAAAWAFGDSSSFDLTVAAGPHERSVKSVETPSFTSETKRRNRFFSIVEHWK